MSAGKLNSIGARCRYARICANLSQRQLAEKMYVNQKTISNLENGIGYSTATITKLGLVFDIDWITTGIGEPPVPAAKKPRYQSQQEEIDELKRQVIWLQAQVDLLSKFLDVELSHEAT